MKLSSFTLILVALTATSKLLTIENHLDKMVQWQFIKKDTLPQVQKSIKQKEQQITQLTENYQEIEGFIHTIEINLQTATEPSFVVSQKKQIEDYNTTLKAYADQLAAHKSEKIRLKEKYTRLLRKEYPPKTLQK